MAAKIQMIKNEYGELGFTDTEISNFLKVNPKLNLDTIICTNPEKFNDSVQRTYSDISPLKNWHDIQHSEKLEEFHKNNQKNWLMPNEYKTLDIEQHVLNLCQNAIEVERVKLELALFKDRELIPLLQYLKYLMDTITQNNVILGIGRGSSCASYILFLLGVHKIDSIKYNLNIHEFLR
jgi:DNA polymerase III alpha subunit